MREKKMVYFYIMFPILVIELLIAFMRLRHMDS